MKTKSIIAAAIIALLINIAPIEGRGGRPAPPPSRYTYELKFDLKALPKGVAIKVANDQHGHRNFISNASDVPLIFNEKFSGERLVAGTKIVSGKVYNYYPNGVPMAGKQHLKGWQAPFGDIKQTLIMLPKEPAKIYEGRKPGLSKDLPKPEPFAIPAKLNGKPYEVKGMIHYKLNKAYDDHDWNTPGKGRIDG